MDVSPAQAETQLMQRSQRCSKLDFGQGRGEMSSSSLVEGKIELRISALAAQINETVLTEPTTSGVWSSPGMTKLNSLAACGFFHPTKAPVEKGILWNLPANGSILQRFWMGLEQPGRVERDPWQEVTLDGL